MKGNLWPGRILLVGFFVVGIHMYWTHGNRYDQYLQINILDVGQGSALLVQSPSGQDMVVDAGPNRAVLREIARYRYFWERDINFLALSHPDQDHIGGAVDLLKRYQVHQVVLTDQEADTELYRAVERAVLDEQSNRSVVHAGDVVDMGQGVMAHILWPTKNHPATQNRNDGSIVMQVRYGTHRVLVMGDVGVEVEAELIEQFGSALHSDILVVGHHGSNTSTSQDFLDIVRPQYAVISSGKDNRYGHPHGDVLSRLQGIEVLRTDIHGTIDIVSDGDHLLVQY